MGKVLIEKLLPSLEKMPVPETKEATSQGRQTYEIGLEKVDDFKGDPKALVAALRVFQTCNSQPYIFAGVAYVLLAASKERDDSYAQNGLDAAMEWLEKAQELTPDIISINMIEALIYIYSGRFDDARLVLDYLQGIQRDNDLLLQAEVAYWQRQGKYHEAVEWYQKAIDSADTVPRKLRLRNNLGDCYLEFGHYDEAMEIYQEAIHFAKEDPWLWHNMSIVFFEKEDYKEAAYHNKMALELMDFSEAREMQQVLRSKLGTGGLMSRLLGR
ncbi:MAG: tetratricopeptide repeat protein [Candidatus Promineifilaceae bacterium]